MVWWARARATRCARRRAFTERPIMDDQNDSSSDTTGFQTKREAMAARRTPPGGPGDAPLIEVVSGDEVIDVEAEPVYASEPIEITPVDYVPPDGGPANSGLSMETMMSVTRLSS